MKPEVVLNGDMRRVATMDTRRMEWSPSPSGTVWRKRLHMVGGAETGQVTSVVRYEPGASFPAHDHLEGEEILVLEGTFSDEHGDSPSGTHLLNPEGFRHAPFSREGCVILVKLRQYPGAERPHRKTDIDRLPWRATDRPGVEEKVLFHEPGFADTTRLERWSEGAAPGAIAYEGGFEVFVLEGALDTERDSYEAGAWLRIPDGDELVARSTSGCVLYVKQGQVASLRHVGAEGREGRSQHVAT